MTNRFSNTPISEIEPPDFMRKNPEALKHFVCISGPDNIDSFVDYLREDPFYDIQEEPPPEVKKEDSAEKKDAWGNVPDSEKLYFTWYPYIVQGALNVVAGMPGAGKGLVSMELVSRITNGRNMPFGSKSCWDGNVLWCETEDPRAQVLAPRAQAAEVNISKLKLAGLSDYPKNNLREVITENDVKLVVLSPFISFLSGLDDGNNEIAVRTSLEQLARAVEGTECAILGIMHPNKKTDTAALDRLMGSRAFSAFVRSVIVIADKDDEKRLCHIKHNLSVKGKDLGFKIDDKGATPEDALVTIEWTDAKEENWHEETLWDKKPDGKPKARDWLNEYLMSNGPSKRETVMEAAGKAGYTLKAIQQASYRNKVKTRREGFQGGTIWFMEEEGV